MKRLNTPAPLWLVVLLFVFAFIGLGVAAIPEYTGSFNVASSGTFTDGNQSASSPACYNASKQLNSSCAAISPTFNAITAASLGTTGNISSSGGSLSGIGVNATSGTVQGSSNGSNTSYIPPVYTSSGGASASTYHSAYVTASYSGTCTNTSYCTVNVPSFSGAAAFNSLTTTKCLATGAQANAPAIFGTLYVTYEAAGPTLEVVFENISGSTLSSASFLVQCWGP